MDTTNAADRADGLTQIVTWIPVSERLPVGTNSCPVALVGNRVAMAWFNHTFGVWGGCGGFKITHWAEPLKHPSELKTARAPEPEGGLQRYGKTLSAYEVAAVGQIVSPTPAPPEAEPTGEQTFTHGGSKDATAGAAETQAVNTGTRTSRCENSASPVGENFHNPDNLTPEQVGVSEGWRLLDVDEVCHQVQVSPRDHHGINGVEVWKSDSWSTPAFGEFEDNTYRTKLSRADLRAARGLPPESQPTSGSGEGEDTTFCTCRRPQRDDFDMCESCGHHMRPTESGESEAVSDNKLIMQGQVNAWEEVAACLCNHAPKLFNDDNSRTGTQIAVDEITRLYAATSAAEQAHEDRRRNLCEWLETERKRAEAAEQAKAQAEQERDRAQADLAQARLDRHAANERWLKSETERKQAEQREQAALTNGGLQVLAREKAKQRAQAAEARLAEVMAEFGVTDPCEIHGTHASQIVDLTKERDAARSEVEKLKAERDYWFKRAGEIATDHAEQNQRLFEAVERMDELTAELAEARKEIGRLKGEAK